MFTDQLLALLPEIIILLGIVFLIMVDLAFKDGEYKKVFSVATMLLTVLSSLLALRTVPVPAILFEGHFVTDLTLSSMKAILLLMFFPILSLMQDIWKPKTLMLTLSSLLGAMIALSAKSFLTIYIGIELIAIPLYVLILISNNKYSAEAAMKYLILGGVSSSLFLLGASLFYGVSGTLFFSGFETLLASQELLATLSLLLLLSAFFFKVAVFPFHIWAPDVYAGSDLDTMTFMATFIKSAYFLVFLSLFEGVVFPDTILQMIAVFTLISIVFGNITMMKQKELSRLIAYSSIAQSAFMLLVLLLPSGRLNLVIFYLLIYVTMILLLVWSLKIFGQTKKVHTIDDLTALFKVSPAVTIVLILSLISLAGLPPLPGFFAKFQILSSLIDEGQTIIGVCGFIGSFIGLYAYLRPALRAWSKGE